MSTRPESSFAGEGNDWVTVARIGKTRGLRGELFATGLSSHPDRYGQLAEVWLFDRTNRPLAGGRRWDVESVRTIAGRLVLKFRGVDSIADAEALEGAEVRIRAKDRPALPEDEYYETELVGCTVIDRADGTTLGVVQQMLAYGGPPLLEVRPPGGGEILIPLAKSICVEIDPGNRRIVVELPEGLKDLNRR